MDGKVFAADVYSVLAAFEVDCPARQHAIKKLLMPGQRGAKGEIQDLDEALVSVSRAIDMAHARLRGSDAASDVRTLGDLQRWHADGEPEAKAEEILEPEQTLEPESITEPPQEAPGLVTWRRCVRILPGENKRYWLYAAWYPSEEIPDGWVPVEERHEPVKTVRQLPEGKKP